jgi:outer membrane protein assembly factor BamB
VGDWIAPPSAPIFEPSLPVEAPVLLWSLTLDGGTDGYGTGPVLSGERLVLSTGPRIFFVEKDGSRTEDVAWRVGAPSDGSRTPGPWSAPVSDREGNVYLVSWSGIYSLTPDGQPRWKAQFPGMGYGRGGGEFPIAHQCPPPVLSPEGVLFAVTSDERAHAVDSRTGAERWSAPAPTYHSSYLSRIDGGGGNRLMFYRAGDGELVLDATTGATVGSMRQWCAGSSLGSFGWTMAVECTSGATSFDTCHLPLAPDGSPRTRDKYLASLIAPGERLVMFDYAIDANGYPIDPRFLTLYDRDGTPAAGPAPVSGWPLVVGADGTIYAVDCAVSKTATTTSAALRILAYSPVLEALWRLDVPGQCGHVSGVLLDTSGILYVTRPGDRLDSTNLVAVQTGSPGLANSSWPAPAHDNHGTSWLGQPTRDQPAVDGGGAVVDAGIDGSPIDGAARAQ